MYYTYLRAVHRLAEKRSLPLVNNSREFPTSLMMYLNYPLNFPIHEMSMA